MKQLLLVILFPSFLFAQEEWEHVATSSNKDTYSIRNTIKQRNSDNIVFWVKVQKPDKIEKQSLVQFLKVAIMLLLNMKQTVISKRYVL